MTQYWMSMSERLTHIKPKEVVKNEESVEYQLGKNLDSQADNFSR
jgi:hypothetical protein